MIYDVIIIGGGAAGLYAAASFPVSVQGLILDRNPKPGRKLLLTGAGQCNLTHGGEIKDFLSHYGDQGPSIRSILYRHSNQAVMECMEDLGVELLEREDGKVFPCSLKATEVADALVSAAEKKGFSYKAAPVIGLIWQEKSGSFLVETGVGTYMARTVLVSTGGCSYPVTGSDGSFFQVLTELGLKIRPPKPSLAPVHVRDYPYTSLAGISLEEVTLSLPGGSQKEKKSHLWTGQMLFTHTNFTGPLFLDSSRDLGPDTEFRLNYLKNQEAAGLRKSLIQAQQGDHRQTLSILSSILSLPKRFLEMLCKRAEIDPTRKFSQCTGTELGRLADLLTADTFIVERLGGYHLAMSTAGGILLSEIKTSTMESKRYPGLYFAGEVLDVDGDTGGYNLQFAFSSGHAAALAIAAALENKRN